MRKILLTAFAAILIGGCTPELEADLYIADIYDVYENQVKASIPATLLVPISSVKKCDEDTNKIIPILQKYSDFALEPKGCVKNKGEIFDFLQVDLDMPIYSVNQQGDILNGSENIMMLQQGGIDWHALGAVVIRKRWNDSKTIGVHLVLNNRMDELIAEMDNKYPVQRVSLDDLKLTINILNDTRESVDVSIGGAFIDGEPSARASAYILQRRDDLNVISSDARVASLIKNKFVSYGLIGGRGEKLPDGFRVKPAFLGWNSIE